MVRNLQTVLEVAKYFLSNVFMRERVQDNGGSAKEVVFLLKTIYL